MREFENCMPDEGIDVGFFMCIVERQQGIRQDIKPSLGDDPRHGPLFDEELHQSKLSFFGESPYSKPRTADGLRFWTEEQQILYTKVYCKKNMLFSHRSIDL